MILRSDPCTYLMFGNTQRDEEKNLIIVRRHIRSPLAACEEKVDSLVIQGQAPCGKNQQRVVMSFLNEQSVDEMIKHLEAIKEDIRNHGEGEQFDFHE